MKGHSSPISSCQVTTIPPSIRQQLWELKSGFSVVSSPTNSKVRFVSDHYRKKPKTVRYQIDLIKTLGINSLKSAGYLTVTSKLFADDTDKSRKRAVRHLNKLLKQGVFRAKITTTRPVQFVL